MNLEKEEAIVKLRTNDGQLRIVLLRDGDLSGMAWDEIRRAAECRLRAIQQIESAQPAAKTD